MRLLSLCTGYGGLDLAVEAFFDCELVACAEIDKYASLAIDKHFGVPNVGDIKQLDWASLGEIDIITAGYPCQPFSHAGQRKGTEDERHIWPHIKEGIGILRPSLVILENVRGHLSLGFKEVLQDLAGIGYDAVWTVVRASDVGAPHQRARLFIIAYSNGDAFTQSRRANRSLQSERSEIEHRSDWQEHGCCLADVGNSNNSTNREKSRVSQECCAESTRVCSVINNKTLQYPDSDRIGQSLGDNRLRPQGNQGESQSVASIMGEISSDTNNQQLSPDRQVSQLGWRFDSRFEMSMRPIPDPLVDGKLNTKFVEYMMGLPEGWVTDLPISRAQQFKMLGNGVVPQQAYYALEKLWHLRHAV